jgi:hypothetical protein
MQRTDIMIQIKRKISLILFSRCIQLIYDSFFSRWECIYTLKLMCIDKSNTKPSHIFCCKGEHKATFFARIYEQCFSKLLLKVIYLMFVVSGYELEKI